jgi:hypothetical protein
MQVTDKEGKFVFKGVSIWCYFGFGFVKAIKMPYIR